MRVAMLALIFMSLSIDGTGETPWESPLAWLGNLLHFPLIGPIYGYAVVMLVILGIYASGRVQRGPVGSPRQIAGVSLQSYAASLLAVLALCALGLMSGGDMKMAKIQVQTYVYLLLCAYLCAVSFRGVRDYRLVGRVVVVSACVKALIALWVVHTVPPPFDPVNGRLAVATTHGDSLLFAAATVLLIVRYFEQPLAQNLLKGAILIPLLLAGMVANNRRLVWVEIGAALFAFWVISRSSKVKKFVLHVSVAMLPLVLGYVALGWNSWDSESKLFAPVRTLRSVGDSKVDSSTMYRELENYNLLQTLRMNAMMGTGFGHPFHEEVTLPNIAFFKEYRYMPHNSVLGLLAFTGVLGFSAIMFAVAVTVFLAARSYRHARSPDERIAGMMAIVVVVIFMVHCWGDIGFSERRTVFLLGPAMALAGQLAVATGAWRQSLARQVAPTRVVQRVAVSRSCP